MAIFIAPSDLFTTEFTFFLDGRDFGRYPAAYLETKYGFKPETICGSFSLI